VETFSPDQPVYTVVGTLPMSELQYNTHEFREPNRIIIAREWFYMGADPEVQAKVAALEHPFVKRDVWATILCGETAQAAAKL